MSDQQVVVLDGYREEAELMERSLKSGGGGGTFDGMEPRIAKLETRVDGIERRINDFRLDVGSRFDGVSKRLDRIEDKILDEWKIAKVMIYVLGEFMAASIFAPRLVLMPNG